MKNIENFVAVFLRLVAGVLMTGAHTGLLSVALEGGLERAGDMALDDLDLVGTGLPGTHTLKVSCFQTLKAPHHTSYAIGIPSRSQGAQARLGHELYP